MSVSALGRLSIAWGTGKGGGGNHRRNLGRHTDIQRHKWIHAVGVMGKDRTLALYIDGRAMQSPEIGKAALMGHTSAHGAIGLRFSGMIDEPAVWNRALSKTEVKQLYTHTGGMKK